MYRLSIQTDAGAVRETVSLEALEEGLYGTSTDVRLAGPGGQRLALSAEVALVDGFEDLTLAILADDELVLGVRARLPCAITWAGCLIRVGGRRVTGVRMAHASARAAIPHGTCCDIS